MYLSKSDSQSNEPNEITWMLFLLIAAGILKEEDILNMKNEISPILERIINK